jgi:hypothetical protein
MGSVTLSFIFAPQLGNMDLRLCKPGCYKFNARILTCIETVLHDGDESGCVPALIRECGLSLNIAIKGKVSDRCIFCDSLAGVCEAVIRSIECGVGSSDVVTLREIQEERLRTEIED